MDRVGLELIKWTDLEFASSSQFPDRIDEPVVGNSQY